MVVSEYGLIPVAILIVARSQVISRAVNRVSHAITVSLLVLVKRRISTIGFPCARQELHRPTCTGIVLGSSFQALKVGGGKVGFDAEDGSKDGCRHLVNLGRTGYVVDVLAQHGELLREL